VVRVFISYSDAVDGERAKGLADFLRANYSGAIVPVMALRSKSHLEENAGKIRRLIESCPVFVVFYTTVGRENPWVNQEVGFAMALTGTHNTKILPVFEKREDFSGFLHSRIDNLSREFQIGLAPEEQLWREVGDHIMTEVCSPFDLRVRPHDRSGPGALLFDFYLTNRFQRPIRDATVHFISPRGVLFQPDAKMPFIKWKDGKGPQVFNEQPFPSWLGRRVRLKHPLGEYDAECSWLLLDDFPTATGAIRFTILHREHTMEFTAAIVLQAPFSEPDVFELPVALTNERWRMQDRLVRRNPPEWATVDASPFP